MFERFTDRARRVVVLAQLEARRLNHDYIGTEHMLLGLIGDGQGIAGRVLAEAGVTLDAVRAEILEVVGAGQRAPSGHIPLTPRAKKVLELALREALAVGSDHIGTEHLLLGLIREGEGVGAQVLGRLGGGLDAVRASVLSAIAQEPPEAESPSVPGRGGAEAGRRDRGGPAGAAGPVPGTGDRRAVLRGMFQRREGASGPTARGPREYVTGAPRPPEPADDPVVERPDPTRRLLGVLGRRERNNALIIGPAGCGKSALVRGAMRMVAGDRGPASLRGVEFVELDGAGLGGGVERLVRRTVSAIVLIEDLGTLLAVDDRAGGRLVLGLAALADARSPLALTATEATYERFARAYPALAQRFTEVRLDEADTALSREVLVALRPRFAAFHDIAIADSALDAVLEVASNAATGRAMPGRALDVLDTAAARVSELAQGDRVTLPVLDARRVRLLFTAKRAEQGLNGAADDAAGEDATGAGPT